MKRNSFIKLMYLAGVFFMITSVMSSCKYFKNNESGISNAITKPATIKINELIHDFGDVQQGEIVTYVFNYMNTSDVNFTIDSVDTGSRKINVKWYPVVVKPGEEGHVEVNYNSTGDFGEQNRPVILYANTKEKIHHLVITAQVNDESI